MIMVIDSHLKEKKGNDKCLVGDKVTYADLAFVTWGMFGAMMFGEKGDEVIAKYPKYKAWMDSLM